jgi:hypothetical protein
MRPVLNHLRQNAIAYLALFVALGGTSYAAINLPAGSIGSKQLRNGSITPVKFNGNYINGSIRAWVQATPGGKIQAGTGKPTVILGDRGMIPGFYFIKWKVATPTQRGCFAMAGNTTESGLAGSAEASLQVAKNQWNVLVRTYGPQGQPLAQYFYAAIIC